MRMLATLWMGMWSGLALAQDGGPQAELRLNVCDGSNMINIAPASSDYVQLECAQFCLGGFEDCTEESVVTDVFGRPLREMAFTVDGMAGKLRWTLADPQLGVQHVLFIHPGGQGTEWIDTNREFWSGLERDGVRTVSVRWTPGVVDPVTGQPWGWFSKKSAADGGYREATKRPAEVMKWIVTNLRPEGSTFGVIGNSNGALATMSAVYWHGVGDDLDYLLLNSGAAQYDIGARCKAYAGSLPATGICENDPGLVCSTDVDCGGFSNKCAFPAMEDYWSARRMDYRLNAGDACVSGSASPQFAVNSLGGSPGDWSHDFAIDVVIAEGDLDRPDRGDTVLGYTWQMAQIFNELETSSPLGKRWADHRGYTHGAGAKDPACLPYFECAIRRGLGVQPLCSDPAVPPSRE